MVVCVVLTIGIGFLPGKVLDGAVRAGQSLGESAAQQTNPTQPAKVASPSPQPGTLPVTVADQLH
jgi:hypothetical protein